MSENNEAKTLMIMRTSAKHCVMWIIMSALIALTGLITIPATQAYADDWHNEYSCDGEWSSGSCPYKAGYSWSCSHSHDGSYGTNADGTPVRPYHFYTCHSYKNGGSGGSGGGTTTPTYYYYATLYYDANGGSDTVASQRQSSTLYGSALSFTVSSAKPTRDGYTFLGWNTDKNASSASVQPGGRITVNAGSSKTLYAIWKAVPKDTTKPEFKGVEDKTITVGDKFDPKAGVTASDDTDGDVTANLTVTGNVDTTRPGKYELTYSVSDAAGNRAEVKRIITVNPVMHASMPATGSADAIGIGGGAALLLLSAVCLQRLARRKKLLS